MEYNKKKLALSYLLIAFGIIIVFAALTFALFSLYKDYLVDRQMLKNIILLSVLTVPVGTFTGCVFWGMKVKDKLNKKRIILLFCLFIFVIAFVIVSGIVLTIPYIIYSIYVLIKHGN